MDGRLWICGIAVAIAMFGLAWDFLYPFPPLSPCSHHMLGLLLSAYGGPNSLHHLQRKGYFLRGHAEGPRWSGP